MSSNSVFTPHDIEVLKAYVKQNNENKCSVALSDDKTDCNTKLT